MEEVVTRSPPTIVYFYGPPASGKLTIATRLGEMSGIPVFHNHLTIDALTSVFQFGSDPFVEVLHRIRLDVFATAVTAGQSLIFTNNSAWSGDDGWVRFRAFANEARDVVNQSGGRVVFVQVVASLATLEERLGNPDRAKRGKLVDVDRLREILRQHPSGPLHDDDFVVRSDRVPPDESASQVWARLRDSTR